jgi:outer membrane lipoprotein-sorting protein
MIVLPLLAGCGGGAGTGGTSADELALSIRTEYLAMTACSATVDITADYGQRVYEYTLAVSWQKGGETVLTVLEPENIAGITARIEDGSTYLEYDGVSLETGPLTAEGFSPLEAVPTIFSYIFSGYIAECDLETEGETGQLWVCCRDPESDPGTGTEAAFWFDGDSHALARAELLSDGYTVLQCEFTDFTKE